MRRRAFLAAAATGALAGCAGYRGRSSSVDPLADLPVSESALVDGTPRDAIPAITDPTFAADWSSVVLEARTEFGVRTITPRLAGFDRVIGVERDGVDRAYPLRVLDWHEAVNDAFGGPLVVTYCPLCGSAVVADRTVAGATRTFGVSGKLWRDNLVLYDAGTESLWAQVAATAIRGPLTGTELRLRPASLTTWDDWRTAHPDTDVLLPPPYSGTVKGRGPAAVRDYTAFPYAGYEATDRIGISGRTPADGLDPKVQVLGLAHGSDAVAFPRPAVVEAGVVTDRVGGRAVVITVADGALVAYDARVAGRARRFRPASADTMDAAGSRWDQATGAALDGPHAGTVLNRIPAPTLFWFSWQDAHPGTRRYRG
jgi:hypothetical protein